MIVGMTARAPIAVLISLGLIVAAAPAIAAPDARLTGRVVETTSETPVQGAVVFITGPGKYQKVITTDRTGRYSVTIAAGTYDVVFIHGKSRAIDRITIAAGTTGTLDGKVDDEAEVIEIEGELAPPVAPVAKNHIESRAPPYSDRAVLSDAWTKAWLLLDVSATGDVTRFKFLRRPGYDLEDIAASEAFRLKFEPARDGSGNPVSSLVVWEIEWPSSWWLVQFTGTSSKMPELVGFPPRRQDDYVPCRGSGPLSLGSIHPVYKDCSKPDLSKAAKEAWVDPAAP
jgi:hypothetical protein